MAEEQKWQEPTNHILCANNCGFFGSPTTLNLCSKCYKHHSLNEQQISTPKIALARLQPESSLTVPVFNDEPVSKPTEVGAGKPSRCGSCRKRVGLTGFTCRCGMTFCGSHRYPEKHECSFDFKTVGKEAIARANPVVKAAKVDKI